MNRSALAVLALSSLPLLSYESQATPGPQACPLVFSTEVTDHYQVFCDANPSRKLVYYVAKESSVEVRGVGTSAPRPRFSVSLARSTSESSYGEDVYRLGGTFYTGGYRKYLQQLQAEAALAGYGITPAPFATGRIAVMYNNQVLDATNGRPQYNCVYESKTIQTARGPKTVSIPSCKGKDFVTGTETDFSVDLIEEFGNFGLSGESTSQKLAFQAKTAPDAVSVVDDKLAEGLEWDDILRMKVDWTIGTREHPRRAIASVRWDLLFEEADTWQLRHNGACTEEEFNEFIERKVECKPDSESCSVKFQYFDENGQPTNKLPEGEYFAFMKSVKEELEKELLNRVSTTFKNPLPGVSRTASTAYLTTRKNVVRRASQGYIEKEIWYYPETVNKSVTTLLNIECIKGEPGRAMTWATDDPICADLLGLAAEPNE